MASASGTRTTSARPSGRAWSQPRPFSDPVIQTLAAAASQIALRVSRYWTTASAIEDRPMPTSTNR